VRGDGRGSVTLPVMRLELHCHSTHSDGSLAAAEVAMRAGKQGVELFCLTDHDSLDGYEATVAALPGVTVLRGLELSCKHDGKTIHLLMYGVKAGVGELEERLVGVLEDRRTRLRGIVDRLAALGIKLDGDQILRETAGRTAGRPDVARALVAAKAVRSMREAFERYLHDNGPADVAFARISLAEGLEMGRAAGARMSLAHPHTLRSAALVADLYRRHRADGLEGIEALYGRYAHAEREVWLRMAKQMALVVTGGSDFHGDAMPEVQQPSIELHEPHATRLRAWLGVDAVARA
jgi:predicted metal-dependent phosphoesterase TrpH